MTKIYGMLINLISYIENNKKNLLIEKNSNELDKIISGIKDDINGENFPFLFKELDNKNNLKEKNEENKTEENSFKNEKKEKIKNKEEENQGLNRDKIINKLENKIKRLTLNYDNQLKKYNNNIFLLGLQQRTIQKLKREINIYKQTLKNKNINPPIISLNSSKIEETNKINKPNAINNKNAIIQKSFSFNNEKGKIDIPLLLLKNKKFNENELYNIDSFRQPSTNNTNINSIFRASSPDSSYSNITTNNFNQSSLNKNHNIKNPIFMKKNIEKAKENKNRRPFSAIRQREISAFNNNLKNSKF